MTLYHLCLFNRRLVGFNVRSEYVSVLLIFCCLTGCQVTGVTPADNSPPEADAEAVTVANIEAAPALSAEDQIIAKLGEDLALPVRLFIEGDYRYKQWHFLFGYPVTSDGSRVDISQTVFRQDYEEGYFDDVFMALLKTVDVNSPPVLLNFSYGATDAPFVGWAEEHDLPMCLFTDGQQCE